MYLPEFPHILLIVQTALRLPGKAFCLLCVSVPVRGEENGFRAMRVDRIQRRISDG